MKRKCVVMLMVIVFVVNITTMCFAQVFDDVPENHWAARYVSLTTGMGIINGYPDGTFKPEEKVKTGEFIKMLAMRLSPDYKFVEPKDGEHWAQQYANLINNFIVDAQSYTYDSLEAVISREEMATMVALFNITLNGTNHITDEDRALTHWKTMKDSSSITESERYYVNYCISHGIINGFEDGYFRPKDGLTRAQATKVLFLGIYN